MTLDELRGPELDGILRTAAKRGARDVRVFGSVARGENDAASDVGLLVDLEPGRSLPDLGGLIMDLEALLQTQVDVISSRRLRERVRERVLRDVAPL